MQAAQSKPDDYTLGVALFLDRPIALAILALALLSLVAVLRRIHVQRRSLAAEPA